MIVQPDDEIAAAVLLPLEHDFDALLLGEQKSGQSLAAFDDKPRIFLFRHDRLLLPEPGTLENHVPALPIFDHLVAQILQH